MQDYLNEDWLRTDFSILGIFLPLFSYSPKKLLSYSPLPLSRVSWMGLHNVRNLSKLDLWLLMNWYSNRNTGCWVSIITVPLHQIWVPLRTMISWYKMMNGGLLMMLINSAFEPKCILAGEQHPGQILNACPMVPAWSKMCWKSGWIGDSL